MNNITKVYNEENDSMEEKILKSLKASLLNEVITMEELIEVMKSFNAEFNDEVVTRGTTKEIEFTKGKKLIVIITRKYDVYYDKVINIIVE